MEKLKNARTVTIDPCHACQPLGAVYFVLGIQGGFPLVHGSQGCCSYIRYQLTRHFREPVPVASTSFDEEEVVFGGRRNLRQGVVNLLRRYHPRFIGVISTCASETIGDDIDALVREIQDTLAEEPVKIVPIHTPGYSGSHVTGYDTASRTVLQQVCNFTGNSHGKLSLIPGIVNPGDVSEIKRVLRAMNVPFRVMTDIAERMDTPLDYPVFCAGAGGTPVEELADAGNSLGIIALSPSAGGAAAALLQKRSGVPASTGGLPVGVYNTDRFIESVKRLAGVEVPPEVNCERGILLDAMADSVSYTAQKKVAVCGDPDTTAAVTRFTAELGMEPAVVASNTPSEFFRSEIDSVIEEYGFTPTVISGGDLDQLEKALRDCRADVLCGPTDGAEIAGKLNLPAVRLGFPVHDRFGYHRWPVVGYRGSLRLLDLIVNTLIEDV